MRCLLPCQRTKSSVDRIWTKSQFYRYLATKGTCYHTEFWSHPKVCDFICLTEDLIMMCSSVLQDISVIPCFGTRIILVRAAITHHGMLVLFMLLLFWVGTFLLLLCIHRPTYCLKGVCSHLKCCSSRSMQMRPSE